MPGIAHLLAGGREAGVAAPLGSRLGPRDGASEPWPEARKPAPGVAGTNLGEAAADGGKPAAPTPSTAPASTDADAGAGKKSPPAAAVVDEDKGAVAAAAPGAEAAAMTKPEVAATTAEAAAPTEGGGRAES